MVAKAAMLILCGYLLGAIPFAYLAGRWRKGIDIRTVGTRNAGAHNVMLEVGRGIGFLVGVLDVSKGALPVLVAGWLRLSPWIGLGAGLAAVLGHNYPPYLGFRGGKGVATGLGALLALMPLETLASLAVMVILYLVTHSFITGVGVGFPFLSLLAWWRGKPTPAIAAPISLLLLTGIAVLGDALREWAAAEDKVAQIKKWLHNPEARL